MLLRYAQYKGVVNLDICEERDAIMADKGFLISDLCTHRDVSPIIPPFKHKRKDSCHMKWKQQKLLPTWDFMLKEKWRGLRTSGF